MKGKEEDRKAKQYGEEVFDTSYLAAIIIMPTEGCRATEQKTPVIRLPRDKSEYSR